jgi:hypothetical protein
MTPPTPLEDLARLAVDGDHDALDRLVRELQGDVYGLALRMLWNREDAEDATQEISPERFRKRLQHARTAIESFTRTYCGLASDGAVCACNRRVPAALRLGRLHPGALEFARKASSYQEARSLVRRVEHARWALEVHRTSHPRTSSIDFARRLAEGLDPKSH